MNTSPGISDLRESATPSTDIGDLMKELCDDLSSTEFGEYPLIWCPSIFEGFKNQLSDLAKLTLQLWTLSSADLFPVRLFLMF